jgi:hypothetical protein
MCDIRGLSSSSVSHVLWHEAARLIVPCFSFASSGTRPFTLCRSLSLGCCCSRRRLCCSSPASQPVLSFSFLSLSFSSTRTQCAHPRTRWPMHSPRQAVSCTRPRPMSSTSNNHLRNKPLHLALAPRLPCPGSTESTSMASLRSRSRTTNLWWAMETPVRVPSHHHYVTLTSSHRIFHHSISTHIHPDQSRRRRLLWYRLARRLAWDPTPEYTVIRHATQRRRSTRICGQASGGRQTNEEDVVRLGRMQVSQGARGNACFVSYPAGPSLNAHSPCASYPIIPT